MLLVSHLQLDHFYLTRGLRSVQGGVINVDEQTLRHINASEYSVGLADELGGGYMGSVEVLHQLHCLNMLRQASYEDYYKDKPGPWEDSPQILRHHLGESILGHDRS